MIKSYINNGVYIGEITLRKSDKHRKIMRRRIIATVSFLFVITLVLGVVIFGAVQGYKYFFPNGFQLVPEIETASAGESLTEEEEKESEESEETKANDEPARSSEDMASEYESVMNEEVSTSRVVDIENLLARMTLEQKVAQLFFVTPEAVTGFGQVTEAGSVTQTALSERTPGGIIYFDKNLLNKDQTKALLTGTQKYAMEASGIPILLGVDEEGGAVARIAKNGDFGIENTDSMEKIGKSGDTDNARKAGEHIGEYLSDLGFNVDFAPVADVQMEDGSSAIGDRSFGSDAGLVSSMAISLSDGLKENGIIPCMKHFPGFGRADENTDFAYVKLGTELSSLESKDLIPYADAINNGTNMIMAGNMSFPAISGDDRPACMSSTIITDVLRKKMGYNGVVITDALSAEAVVSKYSSGEAAVAVIKAGGDMLLMPKDYNEAYQAVMDAVSDETITEDRIDESVRRILTVKLETAAARDMGDIPPAEVHETVSEDMEE